MSSSNGSKALDPTPPPPQSPSLHERQKSWLPVDYERGWFQERTPLRRPPRRQRRKPALPRRVHGHVRAPEAAPSSQCILSDILNATAECNAMLKPMRLMVELTTREAFDEALQCFKVGAGCSPEDYAADNIVQNPSGWPVSTQEQAGASDGESGGGVRATNDLKSFLQQSDREDRVRKQASTAFCRRKKRKKVVRLR